MPPVISERFWLLLSTFWNGYRNGPRPLLAVPNIDVSYVPLSAVYDTCSWIPIRILITSLYVSLSDKYKSLAIASDDISYGPAFLLIIIIKKVFINRVAILTDWTN